MLNVCIVIFRYIHKGLQKISSNKTEIANIALYILLKQQFDEDNIKTDFKLYISCVLTVNSLFVFDMND